MIIAAAGEIVVDAPVVRFGRLEINDTEMHIVWRGQGVDLSKALFKIVRFIVTACRPVTFREIYDQYRPAGFHAGDGENGINQNARTQIKRLRNAFRKSDPTFDRIETVEGGYRWVPDEERRQTFGGCTI